MGEWRETIWIIIPEQKTSVKNAIDTLIYQGKKIVIDTHSYIRKLYHI